LAQDDVAVTSYMLKQNNVVVQTLAGPPATLTGLTPATQYSFQVVAGDAAGNWSPSGPTATVTTASPEWTNDTVYKLLKPSCGGCHSEGTYPFFASLEAFENGLAYNTAFVVPQKPAQSELVKLLKGQGSGSYSQMPPGQSTFEVLANQGKTLITVTEIEAWILQLTAPGSGDVKPPEDVVLNRRQRAEHIVRNLYDHLGLQDHFFWSQGSYFGYYPHIGYGTGKYYPVRSPDAAPGYGVSKSMLQMAATERYLALGGPDWGEGHRRSQVVGTTFLLTLTQTAQAHCRLALDKNRPEVWGKATSKDTSASNPAVIKENIRALHLRFLGEPATNAQVDALFELFKVYEAGVENGLKTKDKATAAWVSVCATIFRNPLWMTY